MQLMRSWPRFFTRCSPLQRSTASIVSPKRHFAQSFRDHEMSIGPSVHNVRGSHSDMYPRIRNTGVEVDCALFRSRYGHLDKSQASTDHVCLRGKVHSIRTAGSKLCFVDIIQAATNVQLIFDYNSMTQIIELDEYRKSVRSIQRGDFVQVMGHPERTNASKQSTRGELSLRMIEPPKILSPSLRVMPRTLDDAETKMRKRHVDMHLNKKLRDAIVFRSLMLQFIREFLAEDGHMEVQTPILAGNAGGAMARSFVTNATAIPEKAVSLRIAPELWLKRLIVAGFDRIFEIGPSFRNEGLDATHNPEFTTCEFYRAYTDLETLISLTERMMLGLTQCASEARNELQLELDPPTLQFTGPYKRLDFITEIENASGYKFPVLEEPDALQQILGAFQSRSIKFQPVSTLPQVLDHLCSVYLEPKCQEPTWIINHPECLSPLSKSFWHPQSGQRVAARGELFVGGYEVVNTYEEENSPIEQRRKLRQQLHHRSDENFAEVDENYIEVLEWGMPPTGGWGAGIDRLCMLMTGTKRISDVLTFGNLRNIVNLSQ